MEEEEILELQVDNNGLPILDQFIDEGFVDCVFKIQKLQFEQNHLRFHMAASYKD